LLAIGYWLVSGAILPLTDLWSDAGNRADDNVVRILVVVVSLCVLAGIAAMVADVAGRGEWRARHTRSAHG